MPDGSVTTYLVGGAALFGLGLRARIVHAHLVRKAIALNVTGAGVFLVLIALAARTPGPIPDPVPHAMVLTGIVVSVCATALLLALAERLRDETGRAELPEDEP